VKRSRRRKVIPFLAGLAAYFIIFLSVAPTAAYAVGSWGENIQPWGDDMQPWGDSIDSWEDSVSDWDAEPGESNGGDASEGGNSTDGGSSTPEGDDPSNPDNPSDPDNPNNPDKPSESGGSEESSDSNNETDTNKPGEPTGPSLYDYNKYLHNDVLGKSFEYMESNNLQNPMDVFTDYNNNRGLMAHMMFSTYKLGVKGDVLGETIGDGADLGLKGIEVKKKITEIQNYRKALDTALDARSTTLQNLDNIDDIRNLESIDDIKKGLQGTHFTPVSKLNVGVAAVSAGYSAYETGKNIGKLITADTSKDRWLAGGDIGQSLGDTLMSASVIAGGTGVGAPVAAGLFIAGATLWTAGTITKMVVNRKEVIKSAKKGIEKIGNAISSVKEKGESLVKSVSSWFS
jgi:hypothetical protein